MGKHIVGWNNSIFFVNLIVLHSLDKSKTKISLFVVRVVYVQFGIIYYQSVFFSIRLNLDFCHPAVFVNKTKGDLRFFYVQV